MLMRMHSCFLPDLSYAVCVGNVICDKQQRPRERLRAENKPCHGENDLPIKMRMLHAEAPSRN
jgi:hypothetical protein